MKRSFLGGLIQEIRTKLFTFVSNKLADGSQQQTQPIDLSKSPKQNKHNRSIFHPSLSRQNRTYPQQLQLPGFPPQSTVLAEHASLLPSSSQTYCVEKHDSWLFAPKKTEASQAQHSTNTVHTARRGNLWLHGLLAHCLLAGWYA